MKRLLLTFTVLLALGSCQESPIEAKNTDQITKAALESKKKLYGADSKVFTIFDRNLSTEQTQALEFLYAYAPIADMNVDHDMILAHVDATYDAKNYMGWKEPISDELFRHYVLPIRVNNEPIDSARVVIYPMLRDRVKGMSLKDAALEVNHWCHEKMVYTSSDARTSSPLQSMLSAYGRCGEESTFTVAAMRAVGIPARQIYAPRWSHSDDNHAWVEIWGGDRWYYLGACEPEPVLDMGWFTIPASRAMLTTARVFGDYNGSEEIISKNPTYTVVNTTSLYGKTRKVNIQVNDEAGNAVPGAKVEYRIYNYAELFPAATQTANENGESSISLGLGDIIVWASKGNKFGFEKIDVAKKDSVTVTLQYEPTDNIDVEYNIKPPKGLDRVNSDHVTEQMRELNSSRAKEETKIRNNYVASFPSASIAKQLAKELGMNSEWMVETITASRGNYNNIISFLKETPAKDRALAKDLLGVISKKDLRDISKETLIDHLTQGAKYDGDKRYSRQIYLQYLLNPRVGIEALSPYRAQFAQAGEGKKIEELIAMAANIKVDDSQNLDITPILAQDVMALGVADNSSRDIFFVSLARSCGFAARVNDSTKDVEVFVGGNWMKVNIDAKQYINAPMGVLDVTYKYPIEITDPTYMKNFSFARFEGTNPETIIMRANSNVDMGGGMSARALFADDLKLEAARYLSITGTRNNSGEVALKVQSFGVKADSKESITLTQRKNIEEIKVIATLNSNVNVTDANSGRTLTLSSIMGEGYNIVALIKPNGEPTNHSIRAIKAISQQLGDWGGEVIVAVENKAEWDLYNKNEFGKLPITRYVIDSSGAIVNMAKELNLGEGDLPYYIIIDANGKVVFKSNGYQINLGDNISKTIALL